MMTFKSERAAKMAYTKAEKAWEAKRSAVNSQNYEFGKTGWNDERFAIVRALEADAEVAREAAQTVYNAARAQGFYVRSYYFSVNPTRDLIAANMD